jgi:hypothetical protein
MVTIECNSLDEGILKVAQLLGQDILSYGSQNIVDGSHVDTGQLLHSGAFTPTQDGCIVSWGINYADYVEYGREPGSRPPYEPIYEWCKRKLGLSEEEAKKVAWYVCNKIEKEGIEPVAYARNAIDATIRKYSG